MQTDIEQSISKTFSSETVRKDFPILQHPVRGQRLAYLDSAATTQKPKIVIDAISEYYETANANVHRGVHYLSESATLQFEDARSTVKQFINANKTSECIFVPSATAAINLVANSFGRTFIQENDEILISMMEHHSNIVPWQMLCQQTGAKLKWIPMTEEGTLNLESLDSLLTNRTKLVAIQQASNVLGTIHPIKKIIAKAHSMNIPVLIDGAQSAAHVKIDVSDLDCDFFIFSGHKVYGPTGIGVLYGKERWLDLMPPYQGGGEMIKKVSLEETIYHDLPYKFEAGTPPIAAAIGLGKALEYKLQFDDEAVYQHEKALLSFANEALASFKDITVLGNGNLQEKLAIIPFIVDGVHPHDVGSLLDHNGVAIRTGHHCAMPMMDFYKIPACSRVSIGLYNSKEDIEQLVKALESVENIFKRRS